MKDGPYQIGVTLLRLVHSYDNAGDLFKAIRKAHPDAKKKDIVLAALGVMIDQSQTDEIATRKLHAMAMENRAEV
ncbi:hypothetical protein [Bosea sp. 685]|uniref:hypothetical protein n=1 Tax=Bosea sp. 685 TaxID=3080057 RepID=UPI002892DE31|nr:hypothetical protein [Bosea sp. 685]WNJ93502.1 hypothetical protein RMR04_14930 [Bosea sp. 685]